MCFTMFFPMAIGMSMWFITDDGKKYIITKRLLMNVRLLSICILLTSNVVAQNKALVNTSKSSFAKLSSVDMGSVQWTKGFWADRFRVCRDSMVPNMWQLYTDANISHSFKNFE